ncbi:MAG: acyltransferase, partial [Lachnospiraceae bacterium]|nr:acyltransferase [Lachnospiraceae bacterium]
SLIYNHTTMIKDGEEKTPLNYLKGVGSFYFKRIKTIFPMFYIAWFIMFCINSHKMGSIYWGGPRKNIILTVLGMDGYFLHHGLNYYCLGEWFLGGIIILYLLFPLVQFLFMKARIPSTILIFALYALNLCRHYFSSAPDTNIFIVLIKYYNSHIIMPDSRSVFTCLLHFWIGMLIITYKDFFINKISAVVTLIFLIIIATVKLPVTEIVCCTLCGTALYILVSFLSPWILKPAPVKVFVKIISKYSYAIFLVHHVILYAIMEKLAVLNFNYVLSILIFIGLLIIILAGGVSLTAITDLIMKGLGRLIGLFKKKETNA